MFSTTRYFGGHRHGLVAPTQEQVDRAIRVDEILVRILGGVPRAPRRTPPAAAVVPLRVAPVSGFVARAAA
jgi:hypothetical protein